MSVYNGDSSSITSSNLQDVQETFKIREVIYGDYDIGIDFRTTVMNAFLKSYKDNRNVEMPQEFRTLFEAKARENIQKEIATL